MNSSNEKRHFTRIPFDARYELSSPEKGQHWEGEILDLSLKGALLHHAHSGEFEPGNTYQLVVSLDAQLNLSMSVSVAHVEQEAIGVRVHYMDLDSATHLRRILELNLGDPGLLERELAEMIDSH